MYYRVLLDDCLSAVDSHVARHIFGALLDLPSVSVHLISAQTVLLDQTVYSLPRAAFS
jgi:hypothetical protein